VNLFSEALSKFGPINVVIANAGVSEMPGSGKLLFNTEGKPLPPNMLTTQVNLLGAMYSTRFPLKSQAIVTDLCGSDALGHVLPEPKSYKGLVEVTRTRGIDGYAWSHAFFNGFDIIAAGLVTLRGAPQYTASKHAVLGFMRAIAGPYAKLGVKITAVAPWFVGMSRLMTIQL
jgi:NAD(P)-dependent dehydrogenase (short-subunit alcohol dehydrogenase family)